MIRLRAQLLIIEKIIKTSSTTTSLWWSSQWGSIVPTTITIAQPYLTCLWWSWCWRWRRHWCCRWSPHYPTIITGPWPELTLMSTHRTEARPSAMKGVALTLGHDCSRQCRPLQCDTEQCSVSIYTDGRLLHLRLHTFDEITIKYILLNICL